MRWFLRWYGANPLHLLTMLGCFALAGYAAAELLPTNAVGIPVWFAGAVIGHDLILMPLYTLADRSVMAVFRHRPPSLPDGAVDQLPARPRGAFRHAAADLVPADLPAALAFPGHDDPVARPLPVALARRDRGAVPAVRRRARPAAAPRVPQPPSRRASAREPWPQA